MSIEFLQNENVLEVGYTTVWPFVTLMNWTFRNGEESKFCHAF